MEFLHWAQHEGLEGLQSVAIVAGLLIAAYTTWHDEKARRVSNWLSITKAHRELWYLTFFQPALLRVKKSSVDLQAMPVTEVEELFVNLLITHLSSSFYAMRQNMAFEPAGLRADVRAFLQLPIPQAVWEKAKPFQERRFVEFVESCLSE
jgi:hypothetical protein